MLTKHCLNCSKELILKCKRDIDRKKYCSIFCKNQYIGKQRYFNDPDYFKNLVALSNNKEHVHKKGHKLEKHPNWKGGKITNICPICQQTFQVPKYKVKEGSGKYCSRKCFEAWQSSGAKLGTNLGPHYIIYCKVCGKERSIPPCLLNTAKYCSRQCLNIGNITNRKFRKTSIEFKLENLVKNMGIEFVTHKNIGKLTIPDIFIFPNIVIYADGDYWHNLPDVVERDIKINDKLKKDGYIVLRFWEHEINENIEYVESTIKYIIEREKHI